LQIIKVLDAGFDCVSLNEVLLVLKVGFTADQIIYTPNNVSEDGYKEAIKFGAHVNFDNLHMLEYLAIKHPDYPTAYDLTLI